MTAERTADTPAEDNSAADSPAEDSPAEDTPAEDNSAVDIPVEDNSAVHNPVEAVDHPEEKADRSRQKCLDQYFESGFRLSSVYRLHS